MRHNIFLKYKALRKYIKALCENKRHRAYKKVLVLFSGGTDSSFLLYFCVKELQHCNVEALTFLSPFLMQEEYLRAKTLCRILNVKHRICCIDERFLNASIQFNVRNRCFYCKKERLSYISAFCKAHRYLLFDGSNYDDITNPNRYGNLALKEFKGKLKIFSPLAEVGFTKEDVLFAMRYYTKFKWGNLSPLSCVATRFLNGFFIGDDLLLKRIKYAEKTLRYLLPVNQLRLRCINNSAVCVEADFKCFFDVKLGYLKEKLLEVLGYYGFKNVFIDICGYKEGYKV